MLEWIDVTMVINGEPAGTRRVAATSIVGCLLRDDYEGVARGLEGLEGEIARIEARECFDDDDDGQDFPGGARHDG